MAAFLYFSPYWERQRRAHSMMPRTVRNFVWYGGLPPTRAAANTKRFPLALISGLDRSKRRLQAVLDGHQFETLNLFPGQHEGRQMKGIQSSQ